MSIVKFLSQIVEFDDLENGILRVNSISRIGDDTFELNGKTSFFSQHGLLRVLNLSYYFRIFIGDNSSIFVSDHCCG